MTNFCLEIKKASKSFPGVKALNNASFALKKGSIHALLGENGAGKSTLIKIITGVYRQDSGSLIINNSEIKLNSPSDASRAGISVVHQERNLIRRFSVGENLMLNNLPKNRFGLIDYEKVYLKSQKWLDMMNLDIDPKSIVSELTVAKMQLCEIAKALSLQSNILLLDEPTSSLSPKEALTATANSTAWALTYTGIEGLSASYGQGDAATGTASTEADATTMKASYAIGSFTVAYSNNDYQSAVANSDQETTSYKVSYTVSDAISVSYGTDTIDIEGDADDAEYEKLSASYTSGGMTVTATSAEMKNGAFSSTSSADDKDYWSLGLAFAF